MGSKFTELIVDCAEPTRLAEFWSAVLGWQPTGRYAPWVELADPAGSSPSLVFIPVPEPKTIKNRLHLDLNPVGCNQEQEVERLVRLGARRVDLGQRDKTWIVLADPEGNEFCVLQTRLDVPEERS